MKLDWFVRLLLAAIVGLLGGLVVRPVVQPSPVQAQTVDSTRFYVEPGYTMLRKPDGTAQMYGKMMIDMRTGDIWGFPTLVESPYPMDASKPDPTNAHPMHLGKFVLSEASR